MKTLSDLIGEMTKQRRLHVRTPQSISWGTHEQCKVLFVAIFKEVDKTIVSYKHLPEYDEVISWMSNTQDKGLLLMGDVGRGKSVILTGVLPVLFRIKNRYVRVIHSQELTRPIPDAVVYGYGQKPETNLDYLLKSSFPIIDEIGVENLMNDYGEKSEGFNLVINAAERYHRHIYVSTNLKADQLLERYGERTIDRLNHLCKIIEFKGDSLRK